MVDAKKETFELAMPDAYPVLFTSARVDRKTVPKDLFCYDVRHDDGGQGIACEVKPHVLVNHWGTILSKEEIPMEESGSYYPSEDLDYSGNCSWWMNICGWTRRELEWKKGTKRMRCVWICETVLTLEMKRAPPFLHMDAEKKYAMKAVRVRCGGYSIVQGTERFWGDGCVRKVKMRRKQDVKVILQQPTVMCARKTDAAATGIPSKGRRYLDHE